VILSTCSAKIQVIHVFVLAMVFDISMCRFVRYSLTTKEFKQKLRNIDKVVQNAVTYKPSCN